MKRTSIFTGLLIVGGISLFLVWCIDPYNIGKVPGNPHAYVCDSIIKAPSIQDTTRFSKCDTVRPGDSLTFFGIIVPYDPRVRSFKWDYADGMQDTQAISIHSYTKGGIYHAVFSFEDSVGHAFTDTATVCVNTSPDSVILLSPVKESTTEPLTPLLSWKGYDGDLFDTTLAYMVLVKINDGNIDTALRWIDTTSIVLDKNLKNGDKISWIVFAKDRFDAIVASDTGRFSIQRSNNATLSNVSFSNGALIPKFNSEDTIYFDTVSNAVTSVIMNFSLKEDQASISINGGEVDSGLISYKLDLPKLSNGFTIKVTAPDKITCKTYMINIIRLPSANALLSSLKASVGELYPAFLDTVLNYYDTVLVGTQSISIIPRVQDSTATISVNGIVCKSGDSSSTITLVSNKTNTISMVVTAQDGIAKKNYKIQIIFKSQLLLSPSNATATAHGTSSMLITWKDNSSNESGFKIQRSLFSDSGFIEMNTVDSNKTTFTDTGLIPGTAYYYKVYAFNPNGNSDFSNKVTAITKVQLSVSVAHSLGGTISILPNQNVFNFGDTVKIAATSSEGFHFYGWQGDTTIIDNPLRIILKRNMNIQANFNNRAPIFQNLKDTAAIEGKSLTLAIAASDPDGDSVILLTGTLPTGATFNAATGTFQWTPTHNQLGIYSISFVATDGKLNTTAAITIVVSTLPIIDNQPISQTLCSGQKAVLSIIASGSGPLEYQWKRSGIDINGATACSLSFESVALSDTGVYDCYISNGFGNATSGLCTLTVNIAPEISENLQNLIRCIDDAAVLKAKAIGTAPIKYQWRKNGENIAGATADSFFIASVVIADTGSYSCSIENACGNKTTNGAYLSVNVKSTAPTGISATQTLICQGSSTSLSVLGGSLGSGAAWTWYANNCNGISIGTGGSITVTPNSTATYFVRAEGSCNITPCASVTITVKPISIIPSGITADKSAICQGDSARLTISGGSLGTGAAWEWYSGSCTGGTYLGVGTSIVVKPTSTTQYSLRGRGDCNTTDWVGETITVNMPSQAPTTTSASSAIICQGASTTLSVSGGALGTGAVWQWYSGSCGGTKIDTGISISVSPTLTTTYYVRAEGTCNTTTCSSIIVNVDSLSVAPSSASANPSAICPGAQSVLTVNGGKLGSGAKWKWYAGSCGGTPIDSGASITVWPATAKNYYVRAEGKCNSTNCAVISVSIKATSLAPTSASAIPEAVCNGITSTLSIIGGVLNNGDVWKWYANSCGGTLVGTGAQINVAPSAPTTYFVRAEGECGLTQCASVAVDYVTNTKPVFIYPTNNQQLDFEGDYIFRTQKVCGSTGYLWGFFQNNILIWENYRDEGHLSGVDYAIQAGTLAHSKFQAGSVTVSIRASVNNNWTNATTIIINLVPR